jgi:uncharacterized protein YkwD
MFKHAWALFLVVVLSLILALAGCETLFNPSGGGSPAEIEKEIFKLVNDYRRSQGLSDVTWNDTIADAAREHSREMAAGTIPFGHDGWSDRWARLGQFLPWQSIAEVVARSGSAADTVNAWIASPDHQIYLVGDYSLAGVGVSIPDYVGAAFYATQIFIKPR